MKTIMFICAGNQCRSPMAEGLCMRIIETEHLTGAVQACSAGIYASNGIPPTRKTCETMIRKNIDMSRKVSKALGRELVAESDIVITMEKEQKNLLQSSFPEFREKIFSLKELAGETGDIIDPMGGSIDVYENRSNEIETALIKAKMRIFKFLGLL